MEGSRYVAYEESTPWPWWVALIVWGGFAAAAVALFLEGASMARFAGAAALLAGPLAFQALFGRLVVRVTRTSLLISFGHLALIQKLVRFDDIREMEPVTYSPIREFGGWGIRFGRHGKRAWTIRGSRALRLELVDGTVLYVGSQDPERLLARIRLASGKR